MPRRGSFRNCFDQMVEMVGREPSLRMIILFDTEASNYILARVGEVAALVNRYNADQLRTVVRPTYNELREVLKERQLDIFKEDKSVDNSKNLQTGE